MQLVILYSMYLSWPPLAEGMVTARVAFGITAPFMESSMNFALVWSCFLTMCRSPGVTLPADRRLDDEPTVVCTGTEKPQLNDSTSIQPWYCPLVTFPVNPSSFR